MNEEDLRLVKQIVKETVAEILDTEVWDAIFELVNGQEAGIVAFKQRLGAKKGATPKPSWNPDKIKWEQAEGLSGPYERSEDVNNPEFKAMLKDLAQHNGRFSREGRFYWVFRSGSVVGRKKQGKAAETKPEADSDPAQLFPEDLRSLLSFEQKADAVIIKPRQFLGSENFAKIADIVKRHGGEWVSAGNDSHFKIQLRSDSYGSTT